MSYHFLKFNFSHFTADVGLIFVEKGNLKFSNSKMRWRGTTVKKPMYTHFMAMNECKNIMLYKADTHRLLSRTQNICFLISISAFVLKLMVKITSIFFSYRFLRKAWPDIFSLSDHFPTPNPRSYVFFFLCHGAAWLWVMFDVDVAHLGLLWIIVGRVGF